MSSALLSLAAIAPLAAQAERELPACLSAPEAARLARLSSAKRRAEFLAGRLLLRQMLCARFGGSPAGWVLSAPEDGPPSVMAGDQRVQLALSHSGAWVAAALSDIPVGLDLETPGRPRDLSGLAEAVCSADEQARLAAVPSTDRDAAFRVLWTCKEAWLKRLHQGVSPQRMAAVRTRPCVPGAETVHTWTWSTTDVTLAWVHEEGLPAWHGPMGPCEGRAPVPWAVDDAY